MTDRKLLVHIGYHKTGTTWLQRALFKPERGYRPLLNQREVFEYIIRPHGLSFDPGPAKAAIAERAKLAPKGHANLVSSEILCGNPFHGGRESDVFAERLQAVAPDARILITIREQMRMLSSVYMQYVSRGGTMSPRDFFLEQPDIGYATPSTEHFEYHRLIAKYRRLFGAENVLVLTHEQMCKDMPGYLAELADFSGNAAATNAPPDATKRIGASYPEVCAGPFRMINFLRRGPVGPDSLAGSLKFGELIYRGTGFMAKKRIFAGLAQRHKPVSRFVEKRFRGRYQESNGLLREQLPSQSRWLADYE